MSAVTCVLYGCYVVKLVTDDVYAPTCPPLNTPWLASALARGHRMPALVISTRLRSCPVRSTALLSPAALESVPKMLFCTSKILSFALPGGSMDLPVMYGCDSMSWRSSMCCLLRARRTDLHPQTSPI